MLQKATLSVSCRTKIRINARWEESKWKQKRKLFIIFILLYLWRSISLKRQTDFCSLPWEKYERLTGVNLSAAISCRWLRIIFGENTSCEIQGRILYILVHVLKISFKYIKHMLMAFFFFWCMDHKFFSFTSLSFKSTHISQHMCKNERVIVY